MCRVMCHVSCVPRPVGRTGSKTIISMWDHGSRDVKHPLGFLLLLVTARLEIRTKL